MVESVGEVLLVITSLPRLRPRKRWLVHRHLKVLVLLSITLQLTVDRLYDFLSLIRLHLLVENVR